MTSDEITGSDFLILSKMIDIRASHPDNGQTLFVGVGERTEPELNTLSKADRDTTLRRLLVEPGRAIAYGAATHWRQLTTTTIPNLAIMEGRAVDYPLSPSDLLKDAIDIYYKENKFVVPLHLLDSLLTNSITDCGLTLSVAHLIKQIAVTIDIHRYEAKDGGKPIVEQLQQLTMCVGVQDMVIELHGDGPLNGSDSATQNTIQLIARIVRQLRIQHGQLLTVVKACNGRTRDITSYWDIPSSHMQRRFQHGDADVEDMMRVQTHSWAGGKTINLSS